MSDLFALSMFALLFIGLGSGLPLAFVLGGLALFFGLLGWGTACLTVFANSIYGVMDNSSLTAVPLFVLMANFLTASNVTEGLFDSARYLLGTLRGGVGLAVIVVSTVFAACTGVVGASVVTMGLLSIGALVGYGYSRPLTAGLVCAGGSLGILIPPSIMLVVMASTAQISVGKLFLAALLPGLLLAFCYAVYTLFVCWKWPEMGPALSPAELARVPVKERLRGCLINLVPPMILICSVLGSIYTGVATPTEAAAIGALFALVLAVGYGRFSLKMLHSAVVETAKTTTMCMAIIMCAACFTNMFLGLGGDEVVKRLIVTLGLGKWGIFTLMMILLLILGCFLDWMGIVMIVLPIFLPIMRTYSFDMIWLMTISAVMLQTCFLTPPVGYALFYIKGVAGDLLSTQEIYKGIIPFVVIIVFVVILVAVFPEIATWLPGSSKA
ncbi:MAG: TRAP transporter large permease subunit [Deltaproteobacteria bacterium]|nr:TRAP transporter large permease subunit [Deltaproteobacteria bacterium]